MTDKAFLQHFISLLRGRFGEEPHFDAFLAEMTIAYQWTMANAQCEEVVQEDACALIYQLKQGKDQVHFGFMVLPAEDIPTFWSRILEKASAFGAVKLSGPIQGTTYFPYRFVIESDESPFFKGEYFSRPADHEAMMGLNPDNVLYYRSGKRDRFSGIMGVSKPYYDKALTMGLEIKAHTGVTEALFREVFGLIGTIFGENWSFNALSQEELKMIYAMEFLTEHRLVLHTFHLNGKMIGFCRYIENDADTLICKTLGLLPEYRKMGLGNATVYTMHSDALNAGYKRMIYALIYDGNRVQQNMPKDDSEIFRKYASYEFKLK